MKKILPIFLLNILILAGCATTNIEMAKDKFSDGTVYRTASFNMEHATNGDVSLQIQRNESLNGRRNEYTLHVTYNSWDGGDLHPFTIASGNSLLLNIDGVIFNLNSPDGGKGTGTQTVGILRPRWREEATYPKIPEDLLRKISNAKIVKIKLTGTAGETVGIFSETAKLAVKNLVYKKELIDLDNEDKNS